MKTKFFISLFLIAFTTFASAQCFENNYQKPFEARIITYEIDSINGLFDLILEIKAHINIVF